MKLTPIDIQQQQFRRALRGLDAREVRAFLDLAAQALSDFIRENGELRAEIKRVERDLEEHREREASLRTAMLTAQRAIDEIRQQAQKEAEVVMAEAELRAEKLLHNAQARLGKTHEDIREARRQRVRAVEELRGLLNTHVRLLELHEQQTDRSSADADVMVLQRVPAPAPPGAEEFQRASG